MPMSTPHRTSKHTPRTNGMRKHRPMPTMIRTVLHGTEMAMLDRVVNTMTVNVTVVVADTMTTATTTAGPIQTPALGPPLMTLVADDTRESAKSLALVVDHLNRQTDRAPALRSVISLTHRIGDWDTAPSAPLQED